MHGTRNSLGHRKVLKIDVFEIRLLQKEIFMILEGASHIRSTDTASTTTKIETFHFFFSRYIENMMRAHFQPPTHIYYTLAHLQTQNI